MSSNRYVITIDVGGTQIKVAAVKDNSKIIAETISVYESKSSASKQEILSNFEAIIGNIVKHLGQNSKCLGICFAFPGPFDYENGICYISGVGKYDSLYGTNMRKEIETIILERFETYFVDSFRIYFENDARLFALGEYITKYLGTYQRAVFVTLGTGVGSAFIENGKILQNDERIPPGGYLYNMKYENSTIEDRFSARGILKFAKEVGLTDFVSVKDLSDAARKGHQKTVWLFSEYGKQLGLALKYYLQRFQPDLLVIGGQISKSGDLFLNELKNSIEDLKTEVLISEESYISTFLGAYTYFVGKLSDEGLM